MSLTYFEIKKEIENTDIALIDDTTYMTLKMRDVSREDCVNLFKLASNRLLHDEQFVALMMNRYNELHTMKTYLIPEEVKDNEIAVLQAVYINGETLEQASDRLKDSYDIVLTAVRNCGLALQYASDRLKKNSEIVLEAMRTDKNAFYCADYSLRNDANFMIEAGKIAPEIVVRYIPDILHENVDFMKEFINEHAGFYILIPSQLNNDRDLLMRVLKDNPGALLIANKNFRYDREAVKLALKGHPYLFLKQPILDIWRDDKEMALYAVSLFAKSYLSLSARLQEDDEVIDATLAKDMAMYNYLPIKFRTNTKILREALCTYPNMFISAPAEIRDNKELLLLAMHSKKAKVVYIYNSASERLKTDTDVILELLHHVQESIIPTEHLIKVFEVYKASQSPESGETSTERKQV